MSDEEGAAGPRRGGRVRKQVDRFAVGEAESSSSDEERRAPRAKKPRTSRTAADGTSPAAPKRKRKPRAAPAEKDGDVAAGAAAPDGFKDDSPLFNALLSPDIAIQPLVEDWIEAYRAAADDEDAERSVVHELVVFFVRCSGLGADVDVGEAIDVDGVQDAIERIQDESVKTNAALYPLINRKIAKTFKSNLDAVISHLISTLSLGPFLHETPKSTKHSNPILTVLLAWLLVMTTSALRPIRHTSTYITLKINSALCDVVVKVDKEVSLKKRQRDAESKKGKRNKEADAAVKEAEGRKQALTEAMTEISDVMYVHRVRDADPAIRTDCLRELGVWVKRSPEVYARSTYLQYLSRGCNDPDSSARLETVKALASVFAGNAPSSAALRLISRLVEMALRDVDTSIRVNALKVITAIDETGVLQDEDEGQETRASVARLVYDSEPRVRRAVAPFVKNLWDERVAQLTTTVEAFKGAKAKRADAAGEEALQYKSLAALLVDTAAALDAEPAGPSKVALPTTDETTRATAAVEALWDAFECLQDWKALAAFLLLDHSGRDEWLLEEEEEDFMVQVLFACIRKDEDGDKTSLIESLPRLLKKHHAEPKRLAVLLSIPAHMDLSQYLEGRKIKQYEALWDDISKQFLTQTDVAVLTAAIQAISRLAKNESMAATNETKLHELDEALFKSLRDSIGGKEVDNMNIDEDAASTFEAALLRISLTGRSRDLVDAMEDNEGEQSTGWTIVSAFAGRAQLGFKEESKLVEYALQAVFLHISWLSKRQDERLEPRKGDALAIFERVGLDRINAAEAVRRQAFIAFLNLHILFRGKTTIKEETQQKLSGAFAAAVDRYADDHGAPVDETRDGKSLEAEYLFLQLVAVFVGVIRCGVVDVDHAMDPLAHFGRFGPTYDAVVKKLVDVLRDEGIYNNEATTVVGILTSALRRSFDIFVSGDDDEPTATVNLARTAASAFIVQGSHFTVLRQIDGNDVADLHKDLIKHTFKLVGNHSQQEKAAKSKADKAMFVARRSRVLAFFRVLVQLVAPLNGRLALDVRKVLEDEAESSGAPINSTKAWEAYRSYEKRLMTIAVKDKGTASVAKATAARQAAAPAGGRTDDEDEPQSTRASQPSDHEQEDGGEGVREGMDVDEADGPPASEAAAGALDAGVDDFGLDIDEHGQLIDLDLPSPASSQSQRVRSVSVEATVKRRKTTKTY